jgi:hypothetical protein
MSVGTTVIGATMPAEGAVLIAGRNAPAETREALLALRPGDAVQTSVSLTPANLREAVGGRPLLVRDSLVLDAIDTVGQPFATGRHPRTAVHFGGRRSMLVVDGSGALQ